MKKQYYPQVMYKNHRAGEWSNIMLYDVNGSKRFASTLEEAKQAIENTRKMWNGNSSFEIVATRIRVREVTAWEVVE